MFYSLRDILKFCTLFVFPQGKEFYDGYRSRLCHATLIKDSPILPYLSDSKTPLTESHHWLSHLWSCGLLSFWSSNIKMKEVARRVHKWPFVLYRHTLDTIYFGRPKQWVFYWLLVLCLSCCGKHVNKDTMHSDIKYTHCIIVVDTSKYHHCLCLLGQCVKIQLFWRSLHCQHFKMDDFLLSGFSVKWQAVSLTSREASEDTLMEKSHS